MKLSKRTNTIILWVISLGLLVSMVIAFTPSLGSFFSGGNQQLTGATVLWVNGQPINELDVARAQQNRLYTLVQEGEVAKDLERLMLDQLIDTEILRQASARTRVSSGEVRQAVNDFRESQGVAGSSNDQRYLSIIGSQGFTDASFRDFVKEQLRQTKYLEQTIGEVEISDSEARAFYEANTDTYLSEARIKARAIVVADQELANDLRARALAGEDFAALAEEYSTLRADRGGALGAAEGSSEPVAVGRAALPNSVANAAFGLGAAGITEVIASGASYYLVSVEQFLPAGPMPFEEVAEQVREDARAVKREGEAQAVLASLRAEAQITVGEESRFSYDNPVIARVGDTEILASDLDRVTYLNQQIQQILNPDNAEIVARIFKPSFLERMIDQELAYQGAADLGVEFVGSKAVVAQSALNYVSRDATVSETEIQDYYDSNESNFTIPASAVATRINFDSETAASEFRQAVLAGESVASAAEANGGTLQELGTVGPGDLSTELEGLLFGTEAFEAIGEGAEEISDVLLIEEPLAALDSQADTSGEAEAANTETEAAPAEDAVAQLKDTYVVLVATRTPEQLRPLTEVRPLVENAVLQNKRQELRDAWLSELRDQITVENLLASVTNPKGAADSEAPVVEDAAGEQQAPEDAVSEEASPASNE